MNASDLSEMGRSIAGEFAIDAIKAVDRGTIAGDEAGRQFGAKLAALLADMEGGLRSDGHNDEAIASFGDAFTARCLEIFAAYRAGLNADNARKEN